MGCHPMSSWLRYTTPPRLTVAGEQCSMWLISSSSRMVGVSGMRSLDASVSILLSSITVFMLSIHSASMSPSSTIHWCMYVLLLAKSRKFTLISPSFHSRVLGCRLPYSSLRVTALGLMGTARPFSPYLFCALSSVRHTADLPHPAGPSRNTAQRTTKISRSWMILRMNMSSGWYPSSTAERDTSASNSRSRRRGTLSSILGNRSLSRPMKMPWSSAVSLPRLKSRSACSSTLSSLRCGWSRFMPPATYSVVLMARSFQS
mmetsp:Transcript_14093/g.33799  ORF Transcript_14093/g.33799 Transcript_14093/m.33799 type:complete len:260 (+) Transcript_14093:5797-6576(+)